MAKKDDSKVFIGKKKSMDYVMAAMLVLDKKPVRLLARGRSISRAVDVAEVLKSRFMADAKVQNIEIGTEVIKTEEGKEINVSAIEITIKKPVVKESSS